MKKHFIFLILFSAIFFSCREGCRDSNASNYDSRAKKSCGCCEYESQLSCWLRPSMVDWLQQEEVTALHFKINDVAMGAFPLGSGFTSAPACNTAGTISIKIPHGTSRSRFYFCEVEDQKGNLLFQFSVFASGGKCFVQELL